MELSRINLSLIYISTNETLIQYNLPKWRAKMKLKKKSFSLLLFNKRIYDRVKACNISIKGAWNISIKGAWNKKNFRRNSSFWIRMSLIYYNWNLWYSKLTLFYLTTIFICWKEFRFATNPNFLISIYLQPNYVNLRYFKLWWFDITEVIDI